MPVKTKKKAEGDLALMSIKTLGAPNKETRKRELYKLLEDGINDIKNGNVLSEEEMDKSIDLM